jgi:hypothetical protein
VEGFLELHAFNFAFMHFSAHIRFEFLIGTRDVRGVVPHPMEEVFQD